MIMALLSTLIASAALTAPQPGAVKIFGDWSVGCDNGRVCEAISLGDAGGGDYKDMVRLRRSGDGSGRIIIHILTDTAGIDRYLLKIDNRLVDTGAVTDGDYPIAITGPDAIKVAKAMAAGYRMQVESIDGRVLMTVSLTGSAAALRYGDAQQGRSRTASAIVAPGRRAYMPPPVATVVYRASALPPGKSAPSSAQLVAFAERSACQPERFGVTEDQAYALDEADGQARALVLIACGAGAYNFASAAFIATRPAGDASAIWSFAPARFDYQPEWSDAIGVPRLVNAAWDPQEQTLSSFAKGRGIGDCGDAHSFVWDGEQFRLILASAMPECRGAAEWITVWRAEVLAPTSASE